MSDQIVPFKGPQPLSRYERKVNRALGRPEAQMEFIAEATKTALDEIGENHKHGAGVGVNAAIIIDHIAKAANGHLSPQAREALDQQLEELFATIGQTIRIADAKIALEVDRLPDIPERTFTDDIIDFLRRPV